MSDPATPRPGDFDCLTLEAILDVADGRYLLDPNPGGPGPLFQVAEEDLVGHLETGEEVRCLDGRVRRISLVSLRRDCAAVRLEYVRLEEALGDIPEFVSDPSYAVSAAPGTEDSDVILVQP
jgi:hypothetical protein